MTVPCLKVSRVASPRYILDTGPLVTFANAADEHHAWAREVLHALGEAPVTYGPLSGSMIRALHVDHPLRDPNP